MHPQWCQLGCLVAIFFRGPLATSVGGGCTTFMRARTPNGVSGGASLQFSAMDFSCVLGFAPLHYTSMQTMRHIHTYMHPQWCQLGCLVAIFFRGPLATSVGRGCTTFMRTRTPNGVSGGAIFCHGFFLCAWMCSAALH